MLYEKKSSGVAKAGLATGATALGLQAMSVLAGGCNNNVLGNLLGGNRNCCGPVCSEDHLVDRYTLDMAQENESLKTQIALRDANSFTDQKFLELYKDFNGRMRDMEAQLAAQAVTNQGVKDSFQIADERMRAAIAAEARERQCCCDNLSAKIDAEAEARKCADSNLAKDICIESKERKCADNTIVTYVNATFYPKQVANVTVGTETTPQTVYNPLPVDDCCNNCC